MPRNDLFCSRPFEWFEVGVGGDTFSCCSAWIREPIGNLRNDTVDGVWNGSAAQSIRRSILDGSFSYCRESLCPYLQTKRGPVTERRKVTDKRMRMVIDNDLVEVPWGPLDINCAYDKSCNLSCPSCRTERIIETKRSKEINGIQKKLESEAIPDARYLYITGSGDAFGSPFFNYWLRTMRIGANDDLHIHLHTNGLLWTPKMWRQIPEAVRARIKSAEISIDAASQETYKLNRRGGSYLKLLKNLEFVSELREKGPLNDLKFSMVVQANNFHEMPAFVAVSKKFNADVVYFGKLVKWGDTFTPGEYLRRAVHLRGHPKHTEFKEILSDKSLREPGVHLGNLAEFVS